MNAREYLEILHVAERLKDTPRHCTTTKGRTESVAEHSWRMSLMASLLRHEFPDLDMISFGPTLRGVHAPGECLELASLDKFVDLLEDIVVNFK